MFDDIHLLEEGNRFVVWTLGTPLAYEVCDIQVVTPEHSGLLLPEEGEDLATLVTCTSYCVNTHRLLVTGRRCAYVDNEEVVAPVEVCVNQRTGPLLIGLGLVVLVAVAGIVRATARRHAAR